jgi:hypothetical protein
VNVKKRLPKVAPRELTAADVEIKTLTFETKARHREALEGAYEAVRKSDTLRTYVKKFKYEEVWQEVTAKGSFTIEVPFLLGRKIMSELSGFWQLRARPKNNEAAPSDEPSENVIQEEAS